ncbi:30S ribosomal protein S6 [Candidatus Uhrbacteria bacterium]|nr:30S ribosomal protein S6 [Candidatus Uhrbacteria bacterium]
MSNRAGEEELAVYELAFLILPSIPENKLTDVVGAIRKAITKEGGVEIDAEMPFRQSLAYSMSKTIGASRYKVSDAYIGWIKFEVEPAKIQAVKAGVEKIAEVLRLLLSKASRQTVFTFAQARKESTSSPAEEAVVD